MTMSSNPIFVVGTPRSGTTLTARILGNHPAIFMPGETHFMEDVYARRNELGDPAHGHTRDLVIERLHTLYGRFNEPVDQERIEHLFLREDLAKALGLAHSYRQMFDTFMERQMASEGRRRWGNQVPRDLFELDQLFDFYPEARVVACIRDLRDFLLSYRDRWKAGSSVPGDEQRLKKLYHPVVTSLLWKSNMAALEAARRRYGERVFVNRYEALVGDPEAQIRSLCAFLGEDFDPRMPAVGSYASSAGTRDRQIFDSSVGRWRRHLSPAEVSIAQKICGGQMAAFGYPTEPVPAAPLAVARHVVSLPFSAWQAIAVNKRVRGPLIPYLAKRLGQLIRQ
jgi:hypothetical protein